MKKRIIGLLMAVMVCVTLSIPAAALGTCNDVHLWILGAGYCNGDGVNIRTGPGKNLHPLAWLFMVIHSIIIKQNVIQ